VDRIARGHPVRVLRPCFGDPECSKARPPCHARGTGRAGKLPKTEDVIFGATPTIGSLGAALNASLGGVSISALPQISLGQPKAPPGYSLQQSQVAQYSKNVYAVLLNGLAAQLGPAGTSVGSSIARENLLGPFGTPPPPAGTAAGIPYAPGANHNDYAAQVMASLRSLAGNGSIFQK